MLYRDDHAVARRSAHADRRRARRGRVRGAGRVAKGTTFLRNISEPTLSVFRPPAGTANGEASSSFPVAGGPSTPGPTRGSTSPAGSPALGFTAFVLKYRVQASNPDQTAFEAQMAADRRRPRRRHPEGAASPARSPTSSRPTHTCGRAQRRPRTAGGRSRSSVRARGDGSACGPTTLGMIGFSAGAFLAVDVALDPRAEQLAFDRARSTAARPRARRCRTTRRHCSPPSPRTTSS